MHLIIVLHPEQDLIFNIMLFLLENKFLSSIKGELGHRAADVTLHAQNTADEEKSWD